VAQVRKGLVQWSIIVKNTPPGYLQLISEAEGRMMEALGNDIGAKAVEILRNSAEALKGVSLTLKDIQYIAATENSNGRQAGLLDTLTRMVGKLNQLVSRVVGILGLARKRLVGDSDLVLKKLDTLTTMVEDAKDAMP
jgi:hypothetical protein